MERGLSAPGTEDAMNLGDASEDDNLSHKVAELLQRKVDLDNGELGYIFTRVENVDNLRCRFWCNVCEAAIGSTKSLVQHAEGKLHLRNLKVMFFPHQRFSKRAVRAVSKLASDIGGKIVVAPGEDLPDITPGEPLPPGTEDVVTRVPEIMSTLENMKSPLIGLEFVAEITPILDETEAKYCCLLCNKRGDPRTVLAHLVCFNHRIKYLARYFPKTNLALALVPKVKEFKRGAGEALARIVKEIEKKFGRLQPLIVEGSIFDATKEQVYREMSSGRHFHESEDACFEHLVDLEFIKSCAPISETLIIDNEKAEAKRMSTTMKSITYAVKKQQNVELQQQQQLVQQHIAGKETKLVPTKRRSRSRSILTVSSSSRSRSRSPSRSRSRRSRSRSGSQSRSYRYMYREYRRDDKKRYSRSRSRSPPRYRRRSPLPYRRSRSRSQSRSREYSYKKSSFVWERNSRPPPSKSLPYSRPRYRTYDEERPTTTQSKVAELRESRKKRDLYHERLEKLEREMTKQLKGYEKNPEKHPLYPDEWKTFWNRRYKELMAERKDAANYDYKPEWIKFWSTRMKEIHEEDLAKKKKELQKELGLDAPDTVEVSPTPLEDEDKPTVTVADIKNTWKALTGSEIKETIDGEVYKPGSVKLDPGQPIKFITVLRLLTALESQLGSLGPRINNLLSQAIALEKKKESASDHMIEVGENSVLLETVKEKLKGQLFAGIVDKQMVNATKTAIQHVAELFNSWQKLKEKAAAAAAAVSSVPAPQPLLVPGVGVVDKLAVAKQIASALIEQGKMDVTNEELEQLVEAVVGMAQASTVQAQASIQQSAPQPVPAPVPEPAKSPAKPLAKPVSVISTSSLELLQTYEEPIPKASKVMTSEDMADLTEEDMKTLLQNFKDLSAEEQQCLITYLRNLEAKEPERVEKLRRFVNLGHESKAAVQGPAERVEDTGRLSPFSLREAGANPMTENRSKMTQDEDDEDYSYEDIMRAAEKKVSEKSIVEQMLAEQQKNTSVQKPAAVATPVDAAAALSEAQLTIEGLMGQLPSKYNVAGRPSAKTSIPARDPVLTTPQPIPEPASQSRPDETNLLNDYNYQDDIFGYSNDSSNSNTRHEPPQDYNYNRNQQQEQNQGNYNRNQQQEPVQANFNRNQLEESKQENYNMNKQEPNHGQFNRNQSSQEPNQGNYNYNTWNNQNHQDRYQNEGNYGNGYRGGNQSFNQQGYNGQYSQQQQQQQYGNQGQSYGSGQNFNREPSQMQSYNGQYNQQQQYQQPNNYNNPPHNYNNNQQYNNSNYRNYY